MQGYVTSEPYAVEKAAKFKPGVILLADHGYSAYSTLIETRRDLLDKKPDLVQRFVDASIVGWYNYLYGDNASGNAMIKKFNPEMTDELIAYSVATMKQYGIVNSGDTLKQGIGAMNDERVGSFFDKMARAGVVRRDVDFRKAYTLRFINKGIGLDLRPKNSVNQRAMAEPAAPSELWHTWRRPRGKPARGHQGLRQWRGGARAARPRRAQG